jgi:hypothetical protein
MFSGVLVVKELKHMSGLMKKAAPFALSLALGLTINAKGAAVNLKGGDPATFGGWQLSPDSGVNANGISVNGDTLLIQNEDITFSNGDPQGITFLQVSADAVPFIEIATQTIGNASGANWTGFQFTASGSASFDGISNVFAPPFSAGVDYESVTLNPSRTVLAYSGSQLDGATATWGSSNPGDNVLVDGNPTTGTPFASFAMDESPQGFVSEVVPVAPAAWQCLAGLLALGFIPKIRKAVRVFASK